MDLSAATLERSEYLTTWASSSTERLPLQRSRHRPHPALMPRHTEAERQAASMAVLHSAFSYIHPACIGAGDPRASQHLPTAIKNQGTMCPPPHQLPRNHEYQPLHGTSTAMPGRASQGSPKRPVLNGTTILRSTFSIMKVRIIMGRKGTRQPGSQHQTPALR